MFLNRAAVVVAAFFLLVGVACGAASESDSRTPRTAGDSAPVANTSTTPDTVVTFKNADGTQFTLSDVEGKAKVVNFWATWCAPCIGEMPTLNAMSKKYEPDGVQFVAVSLDQKGPATVEPVLKKGRFAIDFRIAYAQFEDVQSFNIGSTLPHTLVFDGQNRLVKHFDGVVKETELEEAINTALGR